MITIVPFLIAFHIYTIFLTVLGCFASQYIRIYTDNENFGFTFTVLSVVAICKFAIRVYALDFLFFYPLILVLMSAWPTYTIIGGCSKDSQRVGPYWGYDWFVFYFLLWMRMIYYCDVVPNLRQVSLFPILKSNPGNIRNKTDRSAFLPWLLIALLGFINDVCGLQWGFELWTWILNFNASIIWGYIHPRNRLDWHLQIKNEFSLDLIYIVDFIYHHNPFI